MKHSKVVKFWIIVVGLVLMTSAESNADPGGNFLFQGQISDVSGPVEGFLPIGYSLFTDSTGGEQIGGTYITLRTLDDGLVAEELIFPDAFNGEQRWLEISLDPLGNEEILSPRIEILPVPYAISASIGLDDSDTDPANELNLELSLTNKRIDLIDAGGTRSQNISSFLNQFGDMHSLDSIDGTYGDVVFVGPDGSPLIDLSQSAVIDQESTAQNETGESSNIRQTFLAGQSGTLHSVSVWERSTNTSGEVTVTVYEGDGTSGDVVVSQPYVFTPGTFGWREFAFNDLAVVTAGQLYTLQIQGNEPFGMRYGDGDPYPDGELTAWTNNPIGVDLTFQTNISSQLHVYGDTIVDGKIDGRSLVQARRAVIESRLFVGSEDPDSDQHGVFTRVDGDTQGWHRIDDDAGNDDAQWYETTITRPSDLRLKENVTTIEDALAKIQKLDGVIFKWNEAGLDRLTRAADGFVAGPDTSFEEDQQVRDALRREARCALSAEQLGIIAQQVLHVAPSAVYERKDGYLEVAYDELIPLLVEGLKEADKLVTNQETALVELRSALLKRKQLHEETFEAILADSRILRLEEKINRIEASYD